LTNKKSTVSFRDTAQQKFKTDLHLGKAVGSLVLDRNAGCRGNRSFDFHPYTRRLQIL